MALSQHARAVVETYQRRLAYFRGLQDIPGSTWTAETVSRWMVPHLHDATQALYRLGLTRDEVAELLAEPEPTQPKARNLGQYVNDMLRARGG
jgi:hypothetical protein